MIDKKLTYLRTQYYNMKSRVTGKDPRSKYYVDLPICSYHQFMRWAYDDHEFNCLWQVYEAWGRTRDFCSSIDRIDPDKGYVLGNMQYLTPSENSRKRRAKKKPKI